MKKIITSLTVVIMTLVWVLSVTPVQVHAANVRTKTRAINIVYDDSGSMAHQTTRWCQAKYAMEVFTAMMGEHDTLEIFPMSSYSYKDNEKKKKSDSWGKTITIKGSDPITKRVQKVNAMNGDKGIYRHTPLSTVKAAGDDLVKEDADEKWLIVLTDGAFNNGGNLDLDLSSNEVKDVLLSYAGKQLINEVYVAIGDSAVSFRDVKDNNYFYPYDADENTILNTVTNIGKLVYNYQSIPVQGSGNYSFTADIPISRTIVFAQGEKASVSGMQVNGKDLGQAVESDVNVRQDTEYYPKNNNYDVRFSNGLEGKLAVWESQDEKNPFPDGTYSFTSNVSNVEVFFEPGVDIQPLLVGSSGQELNLTDDALSEIEAGVKTIRIRMVNPLTGEVIDPSQSKLLEGAKLTVSITDQNGDTRIYKNGEEVTLEAGEIELFAKAQFKGDIEKSTGVKSLDVKPGSLAVAFSESSYSFDLSLPEQNKPVYLTVKGRDGLDVNDADLTNDCITVHAPEGAEWKLEKTGNPGEFSITAEPLSDGSFNLSGDTISVDCTVHTDSVDKSGSASAGIQTMFTENLDLILTLTLPEENIHDTDHDKYYMFDPDKRGVEDGNPFIKADVRVVLPDGGTRSMTEEEWEAGIKGFSFDSSAANSNIFNKIINFVCAQDLSFKAVKGDELSTYKLYLDGLNPVSIRPYASDLETRITLKLNNGLVEEGASEDTVTVRPLSWVIYLGWLIAVIILIILAVLFAAMELTKKRFDRDMTPNTIAILSRAGISIAAPLPPQISKRKIRNVVFPPWKPEERDVTMKYPGYMDMPLTFRCVATGNGGFIVKNPNVFRRIDGIKIDGVKFDQLEGKEIKLNNNSDISKNVKVGNVSGTVIMYFIKQR